MIKVREDLFKIVNEREYKVAVEIGVKFGYFSAAIMKGCPQLSLLYSVDPWELAGDVSRRKHYDAAVVRLGRYGKRNQILKMRSIEAAAELAARGEMVDFVYIDGDHSRKGVERDIAAWWPLIRPGGLLAGHDYVRHPTQHYGIVEAVDAFLDANPDLVVRLTDVPGVPDVETRHQAAATRIRPFSAIPSWYILRPPGRNNPKGTAEKGVENSL